MCILVVSTTALACLGDLGRKWLIGDSNVGSPGPDRVVFNEAGRYAGAITHTGAGGNAFLGCSGTS